MYFAFLNRLKCLKLEIIIIHTKYAHEWYIIMNKERTKKSKIHLKKVDEFKYMNMYDVFSSMAQMVELPYINLVLQPCYTMVTNTSGSRGGGAPGARPPPNGRGIVNLYAQHTIFLIFFFARFARDWFLSTI